MLLRPFLAAAALTFACAAQAVAHAHLDRASPGADSTVAPPQAIEMTFSEPLELSLSKIMLMTPKGSMIGADALTLAPDGKTLILPLKATPPAGAYNVRWQVLSTDGHKTSGSYAFQVK